MLHRSSSLGFNAATFGMHRFQVGKVTIATNAGVPDRLLKWHGRWQSESAKDSYVKDTDKSHLSVSESLDL